MYDLLDGMEEPLAMSFVLRPHQAEDLDRVRHEMRRYRAVMLVAACGYGKGVITTKIIDGAMQRAKHVLFLVHGRDRVHDMDERVTKLTIPHGVLMGNIRRERQHLVQIASSDTVYRMEHKPHADLIIIDECHLAMSPTFREVLGFYPDAKILGLTATPVLGNGRALGLKSGGIFEAMVCGPSVKQLISEGYLVGSHVMAPPPPADLAGLKKKRTGEFDENQGASICDNAKVIGDIVDHWKRYSSDRKTVSFGFHKAHAFHIAESFRAAGVNFAYVDADTPDGDIHTPGTRKFFWHQYDHGDLVGISSVATISCGWDHPRCKALILASKTSSFPLYHQRLGRGSRPHPGFDSFFVMDHCGGVYEHEEAGPYFESDIEWQLDGDAVKQRDGDRQPRVATCKVPMLITETGIPSVFNGPVENGYMLPCLRCFTPGPDQCPYCGIPIRVKSRRVETEAGELQEVTLAMRQKSDKQLAFESKLKLRYIELARVAATTRKRDGTPYKPGWAAISFHAETGRWPVKAWKEEAIQLLEGTVT